MDFQNPKKVLFIFGNQVFETLGGVLGSEHFLTPILYSKQLCGVDV